MPAHDDHQLASNGRKEPGNEPRNTPLDLALREVLAESAGKRTDRDPTPARADADPGVTPRLLVAETDDDTTAGAGDVTARTVAPALVAEAMDPREAVVIEALLLQIPGVDALAMFKLASAGLDRFAALSRCTTEELADQAGVSLPIAQAMAAELERWKGGLTSPRVESDAQAGAWRALESLLADLASTHAAMERSALGWSPEQLVHRRRARQRRDRVYLSIKAALASIGELDLLFRLEKLSFARRIDELHRLLRAGAAAGVLSSGRKTPMGDAPDGRTHP